MGLSGHSKAHGAEGSPAKSGEAPETGAGDSHEIPLLVSGKSWLKDVNEGDSKDP